VTTQNNSNENTNETTEQVKDPGEMSFAEYEAMRRGGGSVSLKSEEKSAPAEKAEQNESPESGAEEKEAKDESDVDSESDEDSEETVDSEKDKPKKKGGFQRRIDKLNAKAASERARADALEARLAQLESKRNPEPKSAVAEGEPDPETFDTHKEYVKALAKWEAKQILDEERQNAEKIRMESERAKVQKAHLERVESFKEKADDFEEVIESVDDVPVNADAFAALKDVLESSEHGPEIMYELAKNRKEYERICSLSPHAVARELGKLEAKIESRASQEKKPEPKKLTNAPKPIGPVGTGKGAVAKTINDPDLSFSEYERLRRAQLKRKGA
jgi:hypothetical protein